MNYFIDIGSRSIKLYRNCAEPIGFRLVEVVNWDPLNSEVDRKSIRNRLECLLAEQTDAVVCGVGTAAVRRSSQLACAVVGACRDLGIQYETISQEHEAELIRAACDDIAGTKDIVNVGGGSIQIVLADGTFSLITFGISDLNESFRLLATPTDRQVTSCVDWVAGQLPSKAGPFLYSGGEKTYLERLYVPVAADGMCRKSDFIDAAKWVAATDLASLEAISPFGPGWMRGAVASNCIVEAYLRQCGAEAFIASDINIADGVFRQLVARAFQ